MCLYFPRPGESHTPTLSFTHSHTYGRFLQEEVVFFLQAQAACELKQKVSYLLVILF